jgi:hypothetical protein
MATKESTSLYKIFEKNQYNLADASKKSRTWFDQQVLLLRKKRYTPNQVLRDDPSTVSARVLPGRLYMFMYDPKTKDDLPYYDKFPLVFPFRAVPGGFYGINLHYLPYYMRIRILDRLTTFASNQNMDESTRLKLSWGLLNASSRFKPVQACVKHYLTGHVRSLFKQIPANDWATAMLLPVERFVGAPMTEVWRDSRQIGRF